MLIMKPETVRGNEQVEFSRWLGQMRSGVTRELAKPSVWAELMGNKHRVWTHNKGVTSSPHL